MCTYLTEHVEIDGSGKGATGWFGANRATVYVDHAVHAPYGHTVNIDVINPAARPVGAGRSGTHRGERAGAGRRHPQSDRPCAGRPGVQGPVGELMTTEPDYPQMAAARGRIEPAPRRVRGFLGNELVFDTTAARYVWEIPYYPRITCRWPMSARSSCATRTTRRQVQFGPVAAVLPGRRRPDPPVGGAGVRRRQRQPRRGHRAIRVGSAALVRGGRADLRPPAQPLFAGRRAALAPARPGRTRRRRAGRHPVAGIALRNRFAHKVLHRSDRCRLRASGTQLDADAVPVQGSDVGLLVGAGGRRRCMPTWRGPTTIRCRRSARSPAWWRSTTRSSTSSSTVSPWPGRRPIQLTRRHSRARHLAQQS